MPIVTIQDYNDYRIPSYEPLRRQCPNIRTCWPGLSASFNPFVSSRTLMWRRTAFLLINIIQILYMWLYATHATISLARLPFIIAAVLFFFFRAWNLHLIVQMEGDRMVLGKSFGRTWFDGFLWALVGVFAGLLGWSVWKVGVWVLGGWVYGWWVCADIAILGVAWVTTWEPNTLLVT